MAHIQLRYFASLREQLGVEEECLNVPETLSTLADLRDWLAGEQGRQSLMTAKNLRCALNQELCSFETPFGEGDEVAFFPPVTGG